MDAGNIKRRRLITRRKPQKKGSGSFVNNSSKVTSLNYDYRRWNLSSEIDTERTSLFDYILHNSASNRSFTTIIVCRYSKWRALWSRWWQAGNNIAKHKNKTNESLLMEPSSYLRKSFTVSEHMQMSSPTIDWTSRCIFSHFPLSLCIFSLVETIRFSCASYGLLASSSG